MTPNLSKDIRCHVWPYFFSKLAIHQIKHQATHKVGLGCLMTLVSIRTFSVMYDHTFQNLQITRSDIRPHIKWAVILVIAYGHTQSGLSTWWLHMVTLIFLRGLCGYVWVNILTLLPPRVLDTRESKLFPRLNQFKPCQIHELNTFVLILLAVLVTFKDR